MNAKSIVWLSLFLSISVSLSAQSQIAITHGPYLQGLTENEVTIVWTTNKKAISWVELAPNDGTHFYHEERPQFFAESYGFKVVDSVHMVRLKELKPNTTYRYRIYSQEVLDHQVYNVIYGQTVASNVYRQIPLTFTTNNPHKKEISFLVLNDIHGDNALMDSLLMGTQWDETDLVFFNGDMTTDLLSQEKLFDDFMDTAVTLFAKETPFYYARGNHETRGHFATTFPRYFPTPTGQLYYMFRQGPICFLVLDCGEDKPDSDIEYSGIVAFDNYRTEQAKWLEKIIQSDEFKQAPFKVVITHIPPFGNWHGEKEILEKFVPTLNKAGIDLMMCGHLHRYIYQEKSDAINFPILVNHNREMIGVMANDKEIEVRITNTKGKQVKTFNYKVQN
ncbi:MAG: FN3 domain-containing metallophosphoesterase family protein [Bacteroidota bacterium]|jgi:predicted phosphodiesterase|nr:FN3 domain-containing metallophosphoesterase family protein [Bacteroidota bacterium]HHU95944.1 purple acid phosphatase [Petrimonas sp.]